VTTIAQDVKPMPEIPYRGIESFRYIDQRVFCAREEETWDLMRNILINRGVLLYGDSGSGKSSLINAGLIPEAIKENLYAHRLRVQPRRGREIKVERISTQTDDGPPYLPSDLVDTTATDDNALSFEISLDDFDKQLDRLRHKRVDEPRPLLIFDQFEEFITLFEETVPGGDTSNDAPSTIQENILTVLTSILQDESLPVKLLFVFREEYLAKLNILFKAAPELLDQYVRLLPPRVEEAQQIILAPFADEEVKLRFAGKPNHVRDLEHLAKQIATQIQQRSENGFINLTELQIVCRKLWDSRDPAKYFESNGSDIQKVLEGYWADALKKLGDLYEPSIALLGHMITSTNTRNIVSEPDLKSFEIENFSDEQISRSLNALVESRLVRREPRHKIYFYEIVSEFLVPWIRDKKAARRAQIEANRLAAETKQKLKQVERERRYVSIFAIVLGVLLIAAVWLTYLTYRSRQAALEAQQVALKAQEELQKERDRSKHLIDLLNQLTADNPKERLSAVNGLRKLNEATNDEEKLPRDIISVIVAVTANDPDKEVSAAASYFYDTLSEIKQVQQSKSALTNSIIKTAEEKNATLTETQLTISLPPRMYFQLANENQRARADKLAAALRSLGFTIPAYQIVGDRAPVRSELRWYQPANEADLSTVTANRDKALQKCREVDGPNWIPREVKTSASARPNHYELWFGADRPPATPTPTATATPTSTPTQTPTPTPTPTKDVELKLTFVNEDGKPIPYRDPIVQLKSITAPAGRPISATSAQITAPPGSYILYVKVPGYKTYVGKIILQGSEISHQVKLVRASLVYPPVK
jgi:hypothetical protein